MSKKTKLNISPENRAELELYISSFDGAVAIAGRELVEDYSEILPDLVDNGHKGMINDTDEDLFLQGIQSVRWSCPYCGGTDGTCSMKNHDNLVEMTDLDVDSAKAVSRNPLLREIYECEFQDHTYGWSDNKVKEWESLSEDEQWERFCITAFAIPDEPS